MIESIAISEVATYPATPEVLSELSKFNYLFGSNGTGKTTIGRAIADESKYPTCTVTWKGGTRLEPMVYNCDFVERNFTQSDELKGVFTLGEKQVDTLAKLATAKSELDALTERIETLTQGLQGEDGEGGKRGELAALESALKEKAWTLKQKLDGTDAQHALKGYMGSKEAFRTKVLQERGANKASLQALPDLERKAKSLFGQTPTTEALVPQVNGAKLRGYETDPILKKRIIGKDDVDIAAMIKKLGNSDWVREGRTYLDVNGEVCPFCQQRTPEAFAASLDDYFDEAFETDSKAIEALAVNYATEASRIQNQVANTIASPTRFMDVENLKAEKELLDARIALGNQRLDEKKKEASRPIELESLGNVVAAIETLVGAANAQIADHNKMVANLASERATLTAQVWRFVVEELKADLDAFVAAKDGLDKAIKSMTAQIETATEDKAKKAREIRELEKCTTSIQPTIDGINALLVQFGFQSFKLAKSSSGTSYKLVRPDGSDAKATLSEGERAFVTFLYFYHLLKGSESETGMTTDRIVVFDDPVSSLDSDVLFVVGSLVKVLLDEVRAGAGHIKQVFILTHNVYFHKEVTYNTNRRDIAMNEETFWIVRKSGLMSKVEKHPTNPVKTSYDLLWAEVRNPDRSSLTIQNTLRRILESYFKILGGLDFDSLCAMFDGKDRIVCKSLCSWMHDGSHNAHDDLYVAIDDSTVDTYLRVFRAIFVKSEHGAHYKMMMGDAFVEQSEESVAE